MASNKKLLKYSDFDPQLTNQNDKRNLKRARDDMEAAIVKYYNVLGLPAFAGLPIVDAKRGVIGMEIFTMNDALKNVFTEELKAEILEAFQESLIEILTKIKDINDGLDIDDGNTAAEETVKIPKPPKPVFTMNSGEADAYFSVLKSAIALKDGVVIKRKWAKRKNGVVIHEPTPIPSFAQHVENIIPSNHYFGANTKFEPGNLLWRLQLASAYLLTKMGEDFNTFAKNIPEDYMEKPWEMDDLIGMSNNPNEMAHQNAQKRRRRVKVDMIQAVEPPHHDDAGADDAAEQVGPDEQDEDHLDATQATQRSVNLFSDTDMSFESRSSGSPLRQNSK